MRVAWNRNICPLLLLAIAASSSTHSDGGNANHVHIRHHNRIRREQQQQQQLQHSSPSWSPSRDFGGQMRYGKQTAAFTGSRTPRDRDWVFLSQNATVVRAHIGSSAVLDCLVKKKSQYGMITWARLEDEYRPYSVLTIGDTNYLEDKRYIVSKPSTHKEESLNWALRITRVSPDDAGRYECQATTHPPQSIVIRLRVVEAYSQILGTKQKMINSGSTLTLNCVLKRATEKPQFIFWYREDRMINYDADRGISVSSDENGSTLTLTSASTSDSGNYTCSPYNIRPSSVMVHVLSSGEAVEQTGNKVVEVREKSGGRSSNPPSAAVHSNGSNRISPIMTPTLQLFPAILVGLIRNYGRR